MRIELTRKDLLEEHRGLSLGSLRLKHFPISADTFVAATEIVFTEGDREIVFKHRSGDLGPRDMEAVSLVLGEFSRALHENGAGHDDSLLRGELIQAAVCYAVFSNPQGSGECIEASWPDVDEEFEPSSDTARNLSRAAAYLLREIARQLRRDRQVAVGRGTCQLCGQILTSEVMLQPCPGSAGTRRRHDPQG